MRVLGIEGLGDFYKVMTLAPLVEKHGGFYQHCEWQEWEKFVGEEWDVVIGHSLGGDSAVRLCRKMKKQPGLLILCAARYQTDESLVSYVDILAPLDPLQAMVAPNRVTHNFWTPGPLPSAPCKGAVENVDVASVDPLIWHGNVPEAPAVVACLEKFLTSLS